MKTQSINFYYILLSYIKEYRCLKNVIYQIDRNEWPVWLNGWVFVQELSGCRFEFHCSHLKFRYHAYFELGLPWNSGICGVWIHSETHTYDKNIQWQKWMFASLSISAMFTAEFELVFVLIYGNAFSLKFNFKTNRKSITGKFEWFQYFNFGTNFLKNANPFQTTGVLLFHWKPKLRQTKWWVQNGPISKNKIVLPITALFFRTFCFSLRNSYKELIRCTNHKNVHNHTICRRQSFIWGCFLPVSILKEHKKCRLKTTT